MLPPNSRTLTLFCYVALILTLASVTAATPEKRDHHELRRMIKKRQFDISGVVGAGKRQLDLGAIGAGAAPPSLTPSSASTASTASDTSAVPTSTPLTASSTPSTTSDSSTSSSSSTAVLTDSTTSDSSASTTSSSSSTSSLSSSTPSLTATSTTPTDTPTQVAATSAGKTHLTTSVNRTGGTVTATVIDPANASTTPVSAASTSSVSKTTKTTLVVLVAVAASIGAVAVIWTIIRKWKFKPSSDFEDRMQPIDWQPSGPDDRDIPGLHRNTSTMSHGSFHSAGHENNYGAGAGFGSDHGHGSNSLQPLPDHDFTAGPSLAPVGGYADLARGPSPQPQMTERTGYESYGVPLHHTGAYDYNGSSGY